MTAKCDDATTPRPAPTGL